MGYFEDVVGWCSNIFSTCEPLTWLSNSTSILQPCLALIKYFLLTFDVVTDWMNWKDWNNVTVFSAHRDTGGFLYVAIAGSTVWIVQTLIVILRKITHCFCSSEEEDNEWKLTYALYGTSSILWEDFPNLIIYLHVLNNSEQLCGVAPLEQLKVASGMSSFLASLVASIANDVWALIKWVYYLFKKVDICENCFDEWVFHCITFILCRVNIVLRILAIMKITRMYGSKDTIAGC